MNPPAPFTPYPSHKPTDHARVYRHFVLHERFYLTGAWFASRPSHPDDAALFDMAMELHPGELNGLWCYRILVLTKDFEPVTITSPEVPEQDTDVERAMWETAGRACRDMLAGM